MTIEGPDRPRVPRRLVMGWMAALSLAAGVSAELYLVELTAACAMRVASPEEQS